MQNSQTLPSSEIEQQVSEMTDHNYYDLQRLEEMRDKGFRDEEYDRIEQEEKLNLKRFDLSDDDLGYLSDNECSNSQFSEERYTNSRKGSQDLGDGLHFEDEEQAYYCEKGDLKETLNNPNCIRSYDDMGNSSVFTMELNSILRGCNEIGQGSDISSEVGLSK
mmetsp:Transcript_3782/g.3166  ORF Transcript_3782/g.3166 Transcript_3782/m.3166 type:complete len:163 (-) Transcript_3782:233-721(-)